MADLQSQFIKFHELIKIDFDGNKPLRDKRDIIIDALKAGLKKKYPVNTPTFSCFNQGSYDMATGVEPLAGNDYDIDVGVIFNFAKDDVQPIVLKQLVHDILNAVYQRKVEIKRPCVRVQYHKAGEKAYHIDLAIYTQGRNYWGQMDSNTLYIAKGFPGSQPDKKIWEISEPFQLKDLIKNKMSNISDRDQFRRIIRYLKRWKDYNFASLESGKPSGIGLTALCYNFFNSEKDYLRNYFDGQYYYKYNDLRALLNVVRNILNQFAWNNKISVQLPVKPHNDLFEKISPTQMLTFKQKLETLKNTLDTVSREPQITTACMQLRSIFGADFPTS